MGTDHDFLSVHDQDRVPPNVRYPYIGVRYEKVDPPAGWGPEEAMWFVKKVVLWTAYDSYNLGLSEGDYSPARARKRAHDILYGDS